jgi:hypothetical protein
MEFCSFCGNIFYNEEHEVEKALESFFFEYLTLSSS